jgi:hypothetical protein
MEAKQISIDPSGWTGTSEPEWPKPGDYAFPSPLRARESLVKAVFITLICFAIAVLAFLLGLTPGKPSLLALCGTVLFVLFGCGMVLRCYRLARHRDVALELTARGLSWPGMFEKVIPWSEVSEVVRTREFQRRGMAGVHVKIRDYERFKPRWVKNFLGLDTSGVTLTRLPLPSTLDVDPKALLQAIQAHRSHFGRGGRPVGSN